MTDRKSFMSAEQRIAFELATDYVSYKLDKSKEPASTKAALLRRIAKEIEVRHEMFLKELLEKLDIQAPTAALTFKQVADEMFADGINWGRIVVLYTFGGRIAKHCSDYGLNVSEEEVIRWVGEYVCGLSEWIRGAGGWNAFQEFFGDNHQHRSNGLLYTTLGLGTLMAVTLVSLIPLRKQI